MKYSTTLCLIAVAALSACGSDEVLYHGILQNRPVGTAGVWIVDGNPYNASYKTELNDEYGPLGIGSCVEVVMKRGVVRKIVRTNDDLCNRRPSSSPAKK